MSRAGGGCHPGCWHAAGQQWRAHQHAAGPVPRRQYKCGTVAFAISNSLVLMLISHGCFLDAPTSEAVAQGWCHLADCEAAYIGSLTTPDSPHPAVYIIAAPPGCHHLECPLVQHVVLYAPADGLAPRLRVQVYRHKGKANHTQGAAGALNGLNLRTHNHAQSGHLHVACPVCASNNQQVQHATVLCAAQSSPE